MKKLRVFVLAALVLALTAGSAFAATWIGAAANPSDRNKWEVGANWDTGTAPTAGEDVIFDSDASVVLPDDSTAYGAMNITVAANHGVTIATPIRSAFNLADGAVIDVGVGARLTFTGDGYVQFEATGPTLTTAASSAINFNIVIATTDDSTSVPTIDMAAPEAVIAFTRPVNPAGTGPATVVEQWPGFPAPWTVTNPSAMLSVSHTSQVQAVTDLVDIQLAGILRVTGGIETNGNRTSILLQNTMGNNPKIRVEEGASLTGAGGAATPTNDFLRTDANDDNFRVTKQGEGRLTLIGAGGTAAGFGLGENISEVVLEAGNLTFTRGAPNSAGAGGVAAFVPANAANLTTYFIVNGGHLTFSNARAVEPRQEVADDVNRIELQLNAGRATVNTRSIGSARAVAETEYADEAYPNFNKAQVVNFPFPTRAIVGSSATLEVNGYQAFKRVSGSGSIVLASGGQLILTDQSAAYNDEATYFTGSVSGAGGVGFAGRQSSAAGTPVQSQIYPFTGENTYTGDTVVYGKPAVLVLCENSYLGNSALYLRSVRPGKNTGNPIDKVGSLHIVRLAGPSKNVNNVMLKTLKIDGNNTGGDSVATINIDGPGAPDDNESYFDYLATNEYPHLLIVNKVVYDVNKSEFAAESYKGVFALLKDGDGTLFVNGPGEGGDTTFNRAVDINKGMMWFYDGRGIGQNQIRVAADATLRVSNGTTLPANLTLAAASSNFVTEVLGANFNNKDIATYSESSIYAVKLAEDARIVANGGVDLGGVIIWDTTEGHNFHAGYGYKVLEHSGTLSDVFDAQTETQEHGFMPRFLTGWMEKPGDGLNFGTQRRAWAPVLGALEDGTARITHALEEDGVFEMQVDVLHMEDSWAQYYATSPGLHLLVGGQGSFGAQFDDSTRRTITIRGNVNPADPRLPVDDDGSKYAIFTLYLDWNRNRLEPGRPGYEGRNVFTRGEAYGLATQRTYKVKLGEGGSVTPVDPTPTETVTSETAVAIGNTNSTLTASDDLTLRIAATDAGVDTTTGKIIQLKDADGNTVPVSDVAVMIGSTRITDYTARMDSGTWLVTVPAASVPNGSNMAVKLTGTLADGKTIETAGVGSITKSTGGSTPSDPTDPSDPTPPDPSEPVDPSPDRSGGSSGGCDAGFGALSMAVAAAFLLRKKD